MLAVCPIKSLVMEEPALFLCCSVEISNSISTRGNIRLVTYVIITITMALFDCLAYILYIFKQYVTREKAFRMSTKDDTTLGKSRRGCWSVNPIESRTEPLALP